MYKIEPSHFNCSRFWVSSSRVPVAVKLTGVFEGSWLNVAFTFPLTPLFVYWAVSVIIKCFTLYSRKYHKGFALGAITVPWVRCGVRVSRKWSKQRVQLISFYGKEFCRRNPFVHHPLQVRHFRRCPFLLLLNGRTEWLIRTGSHSGSWTTPVSVWNVLSLVLELYIGSGNVWLF